MWELFQKVLRHGITPNQCFLLFSIHNNTTPSTYIKEDYDVLVEQGYIKDKELTIDALKMITQLNNYFTVNKKKTTKAGKRKKILGLQGLQTFASTYKPKTTKRNANS